MKISPSMAFPRSLSHCPNPYPFQVGQNPISGTTLGTSRGTPEEKKSLKALAERVLQKRQMGQPLGQAVGQEKKGGYKSFNNNGSSG